MMPAAVAVDRRHHFEQATNVSLLNSNAISLILFTQASFRFLRAAASISFMRRSGDRYKAWLAQCDIDFSAFHFLYSCSGAEKT